MLKKNKSILFVVLLFLSVTFIKAQGYSFKPIYSTRLDSSKGEELMKQCTRGAPQNAKIFWNVAQADVDKLEKNFKKVLKVKSSSCEIPDAHIKMLDGYLYQYIGVYAGSKKFI